MEGLPLAGWGFKLVELDEEHLLAVATEGEEKGGEMPPSALGTLPGWIELVSLVEMVAGEGGTPAVIGSVA